MWTPLTPSDYYGGSVTVPDIQAQAIAVSISEYYFTILLLIVHTNHSKSGFTTISTYYSQLILPSEGKVFALVLRCIGWRYGSLALCLGCLACLCCRCVGCILLPCIDKGDGVSYDAMLYVVLSVAVCPNGRSQCAFHKHHTTLGEVFSQNGYGSPCCSSPLPKW